MLIIYRLQLHSARVKVKAEEIGKTFEANSTASLDGSKCLQHCTKLPVKYAANSDVWMKGVLFESWMGKLDSNFHKEGRKVS
ncbi:tigger transposable element-derived protein 4 [Plakobranchus ocellatus]|uniref:Tigger transposable element-derived protein 4 n=1 Tax=Plakobranchus ocellatus TaxID=259542 RepID=A0AAV4B6J7_9GAST|nr:tigger transposable element-derived protein 4 [Plakobranchus ocellatus]